MKKFMPALVFFLVIAAQSCASLTSTTLIDAKRSFVLGEGTHPSYTAQVQNVSLLDIEVFTNSIDGNENPLGVLKVGEQKTYAVPANTAVRFKNSADFSASIKVVIYGDSNLSMGYKDNK
jgi:hypothetical protein